MNQLDFANRTAIVTGGAAGIGFAIAQRLVASGATVSLWDRDAAALAQAEAALARGARTQAFDVADTAAVAHAARTPWRALGRIDVLVCSAGITGPNTTTWEYPVDAWRQVIDVNRQRPLLLQPRRRAGDAARTTTVASSTSRRSPARRATRTRRRTARRRPAVIGLTKSLGKELAKTGIRVNCVTPAAVRTAIFDQMSQQHIDFMLSKIPLGRFGGVDEIAALVCWLASEECSLLDGRRVRLVGRPRDLLKLFARRRARSCRRARSIPSARAQPAASASGNTRWTTVFTSPRFEQQARPSRRNAARDRSLALAAGLRAASIRSRSGASA